MGESVPHAERDDELGYASSARLSWSSRAEELALAVVGDDGCVHVFRLENGRFVWQRPALRSELLGKASCVSMRPCTTDVVAAGFEGGQLAVWRHRELQVFHAAAAAHENAPVLAVSWSDDATLLASLAATEAASVLLWRATAGSEEPYRLRSIKAIEAPSQFFSWTRCALREYYEAARRYRGATSALSSRREVSNTASASRSNDESGERTRAFVEGCGALSFAHGGAHKPRVSPALVAVSGGNARVWITAGWESVAVRRDDVRCAAWSPSGTTLLLGCGADLVAAQLQTVTSASNPGHDAVDAAALRTHFRAVFAERIAGRTVYSSSFSQDAQHASSEGHVASDTARDHLDQASSRNVLTGALGEEVESIAWDASGERVAVSFRQRQRHHEREVEHLIALFAVREHPQWSMLLLGYIRGERNEIPLSMQFRPALQADGALLAVLWKSMHVSLVPLVFQPAHNHRRQ